MNKHIARWLLILGFVIVLYYIYKSMINVFTNAVATIESPITGVEGLASKVWQGISGAATSLWGDITGIGNSIWGAQSADASASNPNTVAQYSWSNLIAEATSQNPTAGSTPPTAQSDSNNSSSGDSVLAFPSQQILLGTGSDIPTLAYNP